MASLTKTNTSVLVYKGLRGYSHYRTFIALLLSYVLIVLLIANYYVFVFKKIMFLFNLIGLQELDYNHEIYFKTFLKINILTDFSNTILLH